MARLLPTSGPWCAWLLEREYGCDVDSLQFPIDRSVYFPRPRKNRRPNIVFFAKPEMRRACVLALAVGHLCTCENADLCAMRTYVRAAVLANSL